MLQWPLPARLEYERYELTQWQKSRGLTDGMRSRLVKSREWQASGFDISSISQRMASAGGRLAGQARVSKVPWTAWLL